MNRTSRRPGARHAWWAALLALTLLFVGACTGDDSDSGGSGGASSSGGLGGGSGSNGGADAAPATVDVQPAADTSNVAPAQPVVVTAKGGTLSAVTVKGTTGAAVTGRFDAAKATWTSAQKLAFGTTYTVTATATNSAGKETSETSSFVTATPTAQAFPAVAPLAGTTVGVGLPIRVYLSKPATDRKAVTDNLKVTTSVPTEGAWRWFSDSELHWRPQVYWKPGTRVALDTTLRGVALGGGVWGSPNADRHIEFTIGAAVVGVADARTHQFTVSKNGKVLKKVPTSMGKPGFETPTGTLVVTDKNRVKTMDSTTYGLALDAGGYRAKVEYATRISNGGIFVHSAPWSVAQQGHTNVSHGCLNLSPANAAWYFNLAKVGDVVEIRGTRTKVSKKDGDIYDWSIPWAQWAN